MSDADRLRLLKREGLKAIARFARRWNRVDFTDGFQAPLAIYAASDTMYKELVAILELVAAEHDKGERKP